MNPITISPYYKKNDEIIRGNEVLSQKMKEMRDLHGANNAILDAKANTVKMTLDDLGKTQQKNPETIRTIKWNDYFHKKYKTQTYIVSLILIACILILLLHALVPTHFPMAAGALLSVLFVYFGYLMWDLSIRDHEIFDEYNFQHYTGTLYRKTVIEDKVDLENCIIKNMEAKMKKL